MVKIEEPYILAQIITKAEFLGNVIKLCIDKRGVLKNQTFITQDRVEVNFDMPLSEIVFDFYDKLKSISKGYASFDYHRTGYQLSKLVKLDILLNGEPVDASRRSSTPTMPTTSGARCARSSRNLSRASSSTSPFRPRLGQDHRARDGEGRAQGCDGQVLRWRYFA